MEAQSKKLAFVNAFGVLGYLFGFGLWAWAVIVYLAPVITSDSFEDMVIPEPPPEQTVTTPISGEMPFAVVVIALLVTATVLAMTVVAIVRAPSRLAKTGKDITTKAATSTIPLVQRGKDLPAKEKNVLTARLVKIFKLLIVTIPVLASFVGLIVDLPLPFELVLFINCAMAIMSILWFSLQYMLAQALDINDDTLI